MDSHYVQKKCIDNLIALIITMSSIIGWYALDYIGMNKFWGCFIILSGFMALLIIQYCKRYNCKNKHIYFRSKQNIIVILYLVWMTATYLANKFNSESILYSGKMWFIVVIYLVIMNYYFVNLSRDDKNNTVIVIFKYLFVLGCLHCLMAIYQFIFFKNSLFSIIITDWPANNPASMYANVNGLGTYLFISIVAGSMLLISKSVKKQGIIVAFLIIHCYVLYLTIARTSIVSTVLFLLIYLVGYLKIYKKKISITTRKNIILAVIVTNLIMINVVNIHSYTGILGQEKARSTTDMLAEKNGKGVNNRQFIWKAVIKDYKEYYLFGDGLKYNIVNKINVEQVISSKSKGASRISYHNTLFRYFASNGIVGLVLFLAVLFYGAYKYISCRITNKDEKFIRLICITILISIFAYMQMEEVYLGEVGMIQLVTLILISFIYSKTIDYKKELQG